MFKYWRRTVTIIQVLLAYLVFYRFNSHRQQSFGMRLRLAFQELGVIFVKIGQILAGRYDMLSTSDLQELSQLLDQAAPIPDGVAYRIIGEELGENIARLTNISRLSSASIAQVYTACLDGIDKVVVKVLRPGIKEQAEVDLTIFQTLAKLLELVSPKLRRMHLSSAVGQTKHWLRCETDLALERQNMETFRTHLATTFPTSKVRPDLGKIIVPKTYSDLSTQKVLVMEYLPGTTISDWLRGHRPAGSIDCDQQRSVMTLFVGCLRPIFSGQISFFHADPHAANVVIMSNGDIGLLDFGLVEHYDQKTINNTNRLYFAIYLQNPEMTAKALLRFANADQRHCAAILPDVETYLENAQTSGFADWMRGASDILEKHKLKGPIELATMGKFVFLFDSLAHEFFPGRSTTDLLGEELENAILVKTKHNFCNAQFRLTSEAVLYALSEVLVAGPQVAGRFLGQLL